MACTGRYATAYEYNSLICAGLIDSSTGLIPADTLAIIESALDMAASDLHMALAASNQCSCTMSAWGLVYAKKLNIMDAAVLQNCPCGNALRTPEDRQRVLNWLSEQYEFLRKSQQVICEGATGADYPAMGVTQYGGATDWNDIQIILDREAKTP